MPACVEPKLTNGGATFCIRTIARATAGEAAVPPDTPDVAYWFEGTDTNYVFAFSPTPNNLALETSLKTGDEAIITWANCNSTKYVVSTLEPGLPNDSAFGDQSVPGITIFVQTSPAAEGFVVRGDLVEEYLQVVVQSSHRALGRLYVL